MKYLSLALALTIAGCDRSGSQQSTPVPDAQTISAATTASPVVAQENQAPEVIVFPQAQREFSDLQPGCQALFKGVANPIQSVAAGAVCSKRHEDFLSSHSNIQGWVGTISKFDYDPTGPHGPGIEITTNIDGWVTTYYNGSEGDNRGDILPGTPMFQTVSNLKVGDVVIFDATVFTIDMNPFGYEGDRNRLFLAYSAIRPYAPGDDAAPALVAPPTNSDASLGSPSMAEETQDSGATDSSTAAPASDETQSSDSTPETDH